MLKRAQSIPIVIAAVAASLFFNLLPASCYGDADHPYDWTIEVKTQELIRPFDYTGSSLSQTVKAKIRYYATDHEDQKVDYESIYFCNGKALGLERFHKLDITPGEGVSIQIVPKSGNLSQEERKAAANAILRMFLDAYLNHNAIVSVRVPNDSFTQILDQLLTNPHIAKDESGADDPVAGALTLFIQSESSGLTQQLIYS